MRQLLLFQAYVRATYSPFAHKGTISDNDLYF